jgi:branched chain amino acid efflux pump
MDGSDPAAGPSAIAPSHPDRRPLVSDAIGITVSIVGFAFVYGLSAREAGFTPIDALAMSSIAFAGAAQFAAVGYVAGGLPWAGIILLTGLLNARHLLYSAALRPWMRDVPTSRRALMAHFLTDENFALVMAHFRRIGGTDERAYWMSALLFTFIPWNIATLAGVLLGGQIPDPSRFGIDVIFPAAMIGMAVVLITGRRELVAAVAAVAIGVPVALAVSPAVGIVAGGLLGPLVGLIVPAKAAHEAAPIGSQASAERFAFPVVPMAPEDGQAPTDDDTPGAAADPKGGRS